MPRSTGSLHTRMARGRYVEQTIRFPGTVGSATFVALLSAMVLDGLIGEWSAYHDSINDRYDWASPHSKITVTTRGRPGVSPTDQVVISGTQADVNHATAIINRYANTAFQQNAVLESSELVPYHDTLNPAFWEHTNSGEYTLAADVRRAAIRAATDFMESTDAPDTEVLDIVVTGSNANYNWTEQSDFDIHIVVSKSKLEQKYGSLAMPYFAAKRALWNHLHDVKLVGAPVELYVEASDEKHISSGIYSLLSRKWVRLPTHADPSTTDYDVRKKIADLERMIADALTTTNPTVVEKTLEKARAWRQAGLSHSGEQSAENLAYKELRRRGVLQKLYDLKTKTYDRALSIEEEEWANYYDSAPR